MQYSFFAILHPQANYIRLLKMSVRNSHIAEIILNDFYMYNLLTGYDLIESQNVLSEIVQIFDLINFIIIQTKSFMQ